MDNKTTLKKKITVLFALIMLAVMLIAFFFVYFVSRSGLDRNISSLLVTTVEENLQEIDIEDEYDEDEKQLKAGDKYIEFDDDFSFNSNEVSLALYSVKGKSAKLFSGTDINRDFNISLSFKDGDVRTVSTDGVRYFVYDANVIDGYWLRGVIPDASEQMMFSTAMRTFLIAFPIIFLFGVVVTYLMLSRSLAPVEDIAGMAREIGMSNDLKRRVDVKADSREIEELADAFNGMLQRLENSFDVQRQFISDASHELRTPMSVILAQCEYLLEDGADPEDYPDGLEVIRRQSTVMSGLISDILELSRIKNNSDRYKRERIDLSELLRDACQDYSKIREKNISLEYEIEDGVFIEGDRGLISSMAGNLVMNAYRYGKENGYIHVGLAKSGDTALVYVKDDGIGIDKKHQKKIFDRFYQVDRYANSRGSGLGLSMVKDIVSWHSGSIEVVSEPGMGSVFTVKLPISH